MPARAKGVNVFHASETPTSVPTEVDDSLPMDEENEDEENEDEENDDDDEGAGNGRDGSPTVWDDAAMQPGYDDTQDELTSPSQVRIELLIFF
jgi:hypothetical protein